MEHFARHGLGLSEGYRSLPELGLTKGARLMIQPSPEGLLNTGKVFGLLVAGAGFAECYTQPEIPGLTLFLSNFWRVWGAKPPARHL